MELSEKQIRKANASLSIIMGALVLALTVRWTYFIFTIFLLVAFIPTILYTLLNFKGFNKYVAVNLVKSIICVGTGVSLFVLPKYLGLFSLITGSMAIIGLLLEHKVANDKNHLRNGFWLILAGLILVVMGIFSYIPLNILIVKYVLGALMVIGGIIVFAITKEPKQDIDDILADYERRYQEAHPENDTENSGTIIDSTATEEESSPKEADSTNADHLE